MEKESKSTPGPWKIVKEPPDDNGESWHMEGPNGEIIFSCHWVAYEGGGTPPDDADAELIARAPELLQQVAEITKEKEELKYERPLLIQYNKNLEEKNKSLTYDLFHVTAERDTLREREKELVEALREFCQAVRKSDEKYPDWVGTSEVYGALFKSESLLSKFEP